MHAMLREIDRFTRNVYALEKEIELRVDNVVHEQITNDPDKPLSAQLRSLLRQVPDVVLVSELADLDTATMACEAAEEKLIVSSVPASDAVSGLFRLLKLGVDQALVARSLSAIWSQRLVRKLCEHCKEPYRPKPEFLKRANLPAAKIEFFYRPPRNPEEPCQVCGGTGYFGQTGIFELLVVNDPIRQLIASGPSPAAIKAEARKAGMFYLQEDGLRQVIRGVTSVEELMRILK